MRDQLVPGAPLHRAERAHAEAESSQGLLFSEAKKPYAVSCELGLIETTEPTGGTQHREYWGGPTNGQAAACRRRLAAKAKPRPQGAGILLHLPLRLILFFFWRLVMTTYLVIPMFCNRSLELRNFTSKGQQDLSYLRAHPPPPLPALT